MSLRDAMRKAAGLLVEMPPEDASEEQWTEPAKGTPAGGLDPKDDAPPDIDKLLADAGIKRTVPPGSTPPASPPKPAGAPAAPGAIAARAKTVEQIVRDAPGPNLDEIKAAPGDTPLLTDGRVNFPAIFKAAKLPEAPFDAEKMLEMMGNLPQDVSIDIKRQMVKVTLGALGQSVGATPENIVADASRKLAALAAFAEHYSRQSNQAVERMEAEIKELEEKIAAKRGGIEGAKTKSAQITKACETESDRLDDVLEFFSLDVPPSKYAGGTPAPQAPPSTDK